MADIFISYSKQDPEHTKALATDLEARWYSVWWDTSLLPGDEFPEEIKRQIDAAKAVIVIWTPHSVKSKWVRAEAARADEQGKLITVHVTGVDFQEIPLPFNTRHSNLLDDRDKIYYSLFTISGGRENSKPREGRGISYSRLGIVFSLFWAVSAFFYVGYAERDRANKLFFNFYERCKTNGEKDYSDRRQEWYKSNPNNIYPKTLGREFYQRCEQYSNIFSKTIRDNATEIAAETALLPLPIAWSFAFLAIITIRWIRKNAVR